MSLPAPSEYLSDRRDQAVFGACPTLMVPRHGSLPAIAAGERRLLAAADGLYIEAKSAALHVCWPVSATALPYGPVEPFIKPAHGPVPLSLIEQVKAEAVRACPEEAAALIVADEDGYTLEWVAVTSRSAGHITYSDLDIDACESLVLDIHSHGMGSAFFSATDNESDQSRPGPHVSLVMGRCGRDSTIRVAGRVCVGRYLLDIQDRLDDLGVVR